MNHYAAEYLVRDRIAERLNEAEKARLARLAQAARPSLVAAPIDQIRRLVMRVAPAT
jgi:hypothetical protein